jgi:xylan 1,4-beta-xylosidase
MVGPPTICNPVDLPYRLQDLSIGPKRWVAREGADPSVVVFEGRYYLFMSMSGGFWHSDDLVAWTFVPTPGLPNYDYAPDVREIDGHLVVCASRRRKPCSFFRTKDPLAGRWEELPGSIPFWDPHLFQDDDGRVYLYEGCSNKEPIRGVELDRSTFQPIGEPMALIGAATARHGWERPGVDHDPEQVESGFARALAKVMGNAPYIEGAWMTKHGGRYYLQYAAPGTELNTYADGYYVGEGPLGPFTPASSSPFSSKPGGFITAAGHGSTFQDRHGNWWHAATMRISKNHMFERRIGLFPAGFDDDGVLFCNQELADYPMTVPDGPIDPRSHTPPWMLLSFRRPVTASSAAPGHPPTLAVDEDVRTWWTPADATPGHSITVELGAGAAVHAIQVNLAEHELRAPRRGRGQKVLTALWMRFIDTSDQPAEFVLEGSTDGSTWTVLRDTRGAATNRTHDYLVLQQPAAYRFIRLTGHRQAYGGAFAVSGLRVFGRGAGAPPDAVAPTATRVGPLDAHIEWPLVAGAQGFNVRYGLAPDKLYSSWQVHDRQALDLGALNAGHDYWVAVDSFNENGVTRGSPIPLPA